MTLAELLTTIADGGTEDLGVTADDLRGLTRTCLAQLPTGHRLADLVVDDATPILLLRLLATIARERPRLTVVAPTPLAPAARPPAETRLAASSRPGLHEHAPSDRRKEPEHA